MAKIILISCVKLKKNYPCKACELYDSTLFKKSYEYAKKLNPDKIFILSAKYGLVEENEIISPYEKTLKDMSSYERKVWANNVILKLKQHTNPDKDEFIILAGEVYTEYILPYLKDSYEPLKGLAIGQRLQRLTELLDNDVKLNNNVNDYNIKQTNRTEDLCNILHTEFNKMKRFRFPFDEREIPQNGIYILFENGEYGHGVDRIVRIGTHTGEDQLRSRLMQHFVMENKDRSIFRKNIGRALLNKEHNPYLDVWEYDMTTNEDKERYGYLINRDIQNNIEKQVTRTIQNNFSFVVFGVSNKNERLFLESKIISTVSLCNECRPSGKWLGNFSPKDKIKGSGLWLVNELYKEPFTAKELNDFINKYINKNDKEFSHVVSNRNEIVKPQKNEQVRNSEVTFSGGTNFERIIDFLKKNHGYYCDDCLSEILNIKPRQTINTACRGLETKKVIDRKTVECENCKRLKKANKYVNPS